MRVLLWSILFQLTRWHCPARRIPWQGMTLCYSVQCMLCVGVWMRVSWYGILGQLWPELTVVYIVTVTLIGPPYTVAGDTTILQCTVDGVGGSLIESELSWHGPPTMTWIKFSNSEGKYRQDKVETRIYNLTIVNTAVSDGGEYRCYYGFTMSNVFPLEVYGK
jgi:hypothetical protein